MTDVVELQVGVIVFNAVVKNCHDDSSPCVPSLPRTYHVHIDRTVRAAILSHNIGMQGSGTIGIMYGGGWRRGMTGLRTASSMTYSGRFVTYSM